MPRWLQKELREWESRPRTRHDHIADLHAIEGDYEYTGNPLHFWEMYLHARRHQLPVPEEAHQYLERVAARLLADYDKKISKSGSWLAYTRDALELLMDSRSAFRRRWDWQRFVLARAYYMGGLSAAEAAKKVGMNRSDFKHNSAEFERMQRLTQRKKTRGKSR